jgi:DNA-cytosine methyltransferase
MKYFSMFSGIGGFELGIQNSIKASCEAEQTTKDIRCMPDNSPISTQERRQSATCVGFSEIDKYAIQIYQKHFKEHKNYGNCTKIEWENVPDFELLVGGFPCQAFSIAGKRGGFDDTRGTLFFEIARCLREKQPRLFLLENVKGLLSSKTELTFELFLRIIFHEIKGLKNEIKYQPIKEYEILCDNLTNYLQSTEGISGLQKKLKSWQMRVLQIIRRQNCLPTGQMVRSDSKESDLVSCLNQLCSIENLSQKDISILEKTASTIEDVVSLLKKNLEEESSIMKLFTTSTESKQMTDQKTFLFVLRELSIMLFIMKQSILSTGLWKKISSNLTKKKRGIYYVRTFNIILLTLTELGYDCQWQVLNSKNFGVPQNRERVFIVGHLRGTSRPEVFPIGETARAIDEGFNKKDSTLKTTQTVRSRYGNGTGSHIAIPVLTPDRPEKRQNGRRFKTDGEPAFTQTAQDRHGIFDGCRIRRLTPIECERLQGFHDGWTEGISDTQRYKCLGNAVTTNVITAIMERLLTTLNTRREG